MKNSSELVFTGNTEIPGLWYQENFITKEEEKTLLEECNNAEWSDILKRRVQHYGYTYSYKSKAINKDEYLGPLPEWTDTIINKLNKLGLSFDQMIVNEYIPGQGISAHTDSSTMFKDGIVSISLGSDIIMNFTYGTTCIEQLLKRRSVIILHGESRYNWKHEIKSRKNDIIDGKRKSRNTRISLTFRRVK
jgi:alkylated DNA repair dioxygenase AlkB